MTVPHAATTPDPDRTPAPATTPEPSHTPARGTATASAHAPAAAHAPAPTPAPTPAPDHIATTRSFYDAIAEDYAGLFRDLLAAMPLDRALLAGFAELVGPGGRVADLGCGPGSVTAHLASLGLSVFGVDLSEGMLAIARRENPGLRFEQGSMLDLDRHPRRLTRRCRLLLLDDPPSGRGTARRLRRVPPGAGARRASGGGVPGR